MAPISYCLIYGQPLGLCVLHILFYITASQITENKTCYFRISSHFSSQHIFILKTIELIPKMFSGLCGALPVNSGEVNLTRFSETFGVFSSLSLHFVLQQRQ